MFPTRFTRNFTREFLANPWTFLFALFLFLLSSFVLLNEFSKMSLRSTNTHISKSWKTLSYLKSANPKVSNEDQIVNWPIYDKKTSKQTQSVPQLHVSFKPQSNVKRLKMQLESQAVLMTQRVELVKNFCKYFHLGRYRNPVNGSSKGNNGLSITENPSPLYSSYFFWNKERKFGFCPVYKSGSTSWIENMILLAGVSETMLRSFRAQLIFLARKLYPKENSPKEMELEYYKKLIVVRHPFERILSAYRDKLANKSVGGDYPYYYYETWGKRIVQNFRTDPKKIQQEEPTWEEFIIYLTSVDLYKYFDDHWLPAFYSCTPCLVNYDFIAKVETYSTDQDYIIQKLGLQDVLKKPRWSHRNTKGNNYKAYNSKTQEVGPSKLAKEFYAKLSKNQINRLYYPYMMDFILFGYEPRQYVQLGRD